MLFQIVHQTKNNLLEVEILNSNTENKLVES